MIKIINEDCLSAIENLKEKVDCIVTDPPFFTPATHYQSRVNWSKSWSDMSILETWWREILKKINTVLKPEGHIIVFCNGDSYPVFYPVMFPFFDKLKCMVWDKGRVGLGRIFRNQHELLIWGRNTGHYLPSDGKLRTDVFTFKATPSKDREHPVQKPVEMLDYLITGICPENGIVLDPFMGSGTTGIACVKNNRQFIGIEKDNNYFNVADKLLKDAGGNVIQQTLCGSASLHANQPNG